MGMDTSSQPLPENATRQNTYQQILKAANRRLEQAIPGSTEGAFAHLSLAALLNLLFLIRGEWGSIGDFVTTQRALRSTVGDDLLWAEPQKSTPSSVELVH
jgi:hypothetical protein